MYDPTFEQVHKEQREDASQVADIQTAKVNRILDKTTADPSIPRVSVAGMLFSAGLSDDEAEFISWRVVMARAENGRWSAIVELASACSFDASEWAWREGYGMAKACQIADWVYGAVYSAYQPQSVAGPNGRIMMDKLDVAWASIPASELEPERFYFPDEPEIELIDRGKLEATERAAAGRLRRGLVK